MKKTIPIKQLGINLAGPINESKPGKATIHLQSTKDLTLLSQAINEFVEKNQLKEIQITNSKIPKPKIAILNVDKEFDDELIINTIYDRTSDLSYEKREIEILSRINKTNDDSQTVLCEIPPTVQKALLKQGGIGIGWLYCRIEEGHYTKICKNCGSFKHNTSVCKEKVICLRCSKDHPTKDCTITDRNKMNCVNCTKTNKTNRNHSTLSPYCQTFIADNNIKKQEIIKLNGY